MDKGGAVKCDIMWERWTIYTDLVELYCVSVRGGGGGGAYLDVLCSGEHGPDMDDTDEFAAIIDLVD